MEGIEENKDRLQLMAEDVELKLEELDRMKAEWEELKEKMKEEEDGRSE